MVPDTLPPTSRRQSQFGSIHTFGDLGDYLRQAIDDEDAHQLSESMAQVAARADEVVVALAASRKRVRVAPALIDLMTALREHRTMVLGLGLGWRGLYEYAGYLQSLNNFRILIGEWLLHTPAWDDEVGATAQDVRQVAWRTLGDGMLLLEMYEQWLQHGGDSEPQVREPQRVRVRQWWMKLRR